MLLTDDKLLVIFRNVDVEEIGKPLWNEQVHDDHTDTDDETRDTCTYLFRYHSPSFHSYQFYFI